MRAASRDRSTSVLVGQRLRDYRQAKGWTFDRFSRECDAAGFRITGPTLHYIENGRPDSEGGRTRNVTVDELMFLASVLDVPYQALLGEEIAVPAPRDASGKSLVLQQEGWCYDADLTSEEASKVLRFVLDLIAGRAVLPVESAEPE